jgi:hypothetical protein
VTQLTSDDGCDGWRTRDLAEGAPFYHDISNTCTFDATPDDLAIYARDADGVVLATAHTENHPFVAAGDEWTEPDIVLADDWSPRPLLTSR